MHCTALLIVLTFSVVLKHYKQINTMTLNQYSYFLPSSLDFSSGSKYNQQHKHAVAEGSRSREQETASKHKQLSSKYK